MYISEISLYIGRKLSTDEQDLNSQDKAIYGKVPQEILGIYMEAVEKLKQNSEFCKSLDVSEKAFKQFLKTRKKVSKSCVEDSKRLNIECFHPMFKNKFNFTNEDKLKKKEELIQEIKNYKPKSAYLELHKIQKNEENRENDPFFKIIEKMKNIEKKTHEKKENEKLKANETEETKPISHEKSHNKSEKNSEIRLNKKRMNRIIEKTSEKKIKTNDYRHPTQFISYERQANLVRKLKIYEKD